MFPIWLVKLRRKKVKHSCKDYLMEFCFKTNKRLIINQLLILIHNFSGIDHLKVSLIFLFKKFDFLGFYEVNLADQ